MIKKLLTPCLILFFLSACTPGVYNTNTTKGGKKVFIAECGLNKYSICKKRAVHKCNGSYILHSRYNVTKKISKPVYRTNYTTRRRVVKSKQGHIYHVPYTYRDRYVAYYRHYNIRVQHIRFVCR